MGLRLRKRKVCYCGADCFTAAIRYSLPRFVTTVSFVLSFPSDPLHSLVGLPLSIFKRLELLRLAYPYVEEKEEEKRKRRRRRRRKRRRKTMKKGGLNTTSASALERICAKYNRMVFCCPLPCGHSLIF